MLTIFTCQVDIAEGVEIRLVKIQSVFKEFQWSFSKDTFPRMKDGGTATAQMVDLSAEISFDIVTDAQKAITSAQRPPFACPCAVAAQPADSARGRRVDDVVPVISLAQLNVQVGGGSQGVHTPPPTLKAKPPGMPYWICTYCQQETKIERNTEKRGKKERNDKGNK